MMATTLYTLRLVLQALGIQDFGIYGVAAASVTMLAFVNHAMAQAAQRFLSMDLGVGNLAGANVTFNVTLGIHIAGAVSVLVVGETIGLWLLNNKLSIPSDRILAANAVFHLSLATCIFQIIQAPFSALVIAHEKMWFFSLASVVDAVLKLAAAYLVLAWSGDRLVLYAALILLGSLLLLLFHAVFCLRHFKEARPRLYWRRDDYVRQLSFIGWSMFGNLASAARTQGVNILLNIFFGPAANAAHGVMSQTQSAVSAFSNSFQTALSPQIYQRFARSEIRGMHHLVCAGSRFSLILMLVVIVPAYYHTESLLKVWLTQVPTHAVAFVRGILIVVLLESMSLPLISAAAATGRIKWYQIIVGGALLLNLPLSYIAFRVTGNPESFIVIAIALAFLTLLLRLWFLKGMIEFDISNYARSTVLPSVVVVGLSALGLAIFYAVRPPQDSLPQIAFDSAVLFMVTAGVSIIFGLTQLEKEFLFRKASQLAKKITSK